MTKTKYWAGSSTPKSSDNAFSWRNGRSEVLQDPYFKRSETGKGNTAKRAEESGKEFTVYSRARASK